MQNFEVTAFTDAMMQSAVIELIQKDAVLNPANKVRKIYHSGLNVAQISSIDIRFVGVFFEYCCL